MTSRPPSSRPPGPITWRSSLKNTIYDVLKARPGWVETDAEAGWDFFWADKGWIHHELDKVHLHDWQRINHFPNHYELTRKDLLLKNLKRSRRAAERQEARQAQGQQQQQQQQQQQGTHSLSGSSEPPAPPAAAPSSSSSASASSSGGSSGGGGGYNFFPATFVLPAEYRMLVEEFKRSGGVWIMKPIGKAQGQGIFLFSKLSQISDWRRDHSWRPDDESAAETYLAQRYVDTPYLVGGRKFDLRIYALVTSYTPLRVYLYRSGFARFTNARFSMRKEDIGNAFIHLTNVAIQKRAPNFDKQVGMKWPIRSLRAYLISRHGADTTADVFGAIQDLIIRALLAVQPVMISDKHCFELYGYDVLLDSSLKPWLLEVNASPSLTASDGADWALKFGMLNDMLDIVDLEGRREPGRYPTRQGGFDLIYDGGPLPATSHEEATSLPSLLGCHNPADPNQRRHRLADELQGRAPAHSGVRQGVDGGRGGCESV